MSKVPLRQESAPPAGRNPRHERRWTEEKGSKSPPQSTVTLDLKASETETEDKSKPSLPEVIDRIGFGRAQLCAGLVGGGVFFADGSLLLLFSSLGPMVAGDWGLPTYQQGVIVSVVFMGILTGTFASGIVGDSIGRRDMVIISFGALFVFGFFSSRAPSFELLLLSSNFLGIAVGIGQPAWGSLSTEITPTKWRMAMAGCTQCLFCLGELYSLALVMASDPTMQKLDWRWLLLMGSIPAAIYFAASFMFLPESPFYLAVNRQNARAREALAKISADNGVDDVALDFSPPKRLETDDESISAVGSRVTIVFGQAYLVTTIIVMYSMFTLNLGYYGCNYVFMRVLPTLSIAGQPATQLFLGALWELPGELMGVVLGMSMSRKPAMMLSFLTFALCMLLFVGGACMPAGYARLQAHMLLAGFYGVKGFVPMGFVVTVQYVCEVFPTEARVAGTSISFAFGRLAAIFGPLVFEATQELTGSFIYFCLMVIVGCVINAAMIAFLPYETAESGEAEAAELEETKADKIGDITPDSVC